MNNYYDRFIKYFIQIGTHHNVNKQHLEFFRVDKDKDDLATYRRGMLTINLDMLADDAQKEAHDAIITLDKCFESVLSNKNTRDSW